MPSRRNSNSEDLSWKHILFRILEIRIYLRTLSLPVDRGRKFGWNHVPWDIWIKLWEYPL